MSWFFSSFRYQHHQKVRRSFRAKCHLGTDVGSLWPMLALFRDRRFCTTTKGDCHVVGTLHCTSFRQRGAPPQNSHTLPQAAVSALRTHKNDPSQTCACCFFLEKKCVCSRWWWNPLGSSCCWFRRRSQKRETSPQDRSRGARVPRPPTQVISKCSTVAWTLRIFLKLEKYL